MSAVLPGLPADLRQKLSLRSGDTVVLPAERVIPELAQGAVCLPLGELKALAPEVFEGVLNHDDVSVRLPLEEVLKQLNPKDYARRPGQQKVIVPDEVTGIFEGKGQRPAISTTPLKDVPRPAAPLPLPPPEPARPALRPPQALPGLPPPPPSQPVVRAAPASAAPSPPPVTPSLPAESTAASAPNTEPLRVPLSQLSQTWPEEIRRDIANLNVAVATLALPMDAVGQALKSGQILFPWKQLWQWLEPCALVPPSPAAALMLVELPLKVIAPLFMARYRPATVQHKAEADPAIPELFGRGAKPEVDPTASAPVPPRPAAPPPPPVPVASVRPAPPKAAPVAPAPAKPAIRLRMAAPKPSPAPEARLDLDAVLGPPDQRFSAREIVLNTSKLPGVTGAMLVMGDGLLVTSAVPAKVKSELVAAFLPQMFGRMNQYAKELSLGGLRCLTLTVDGGCWQVVRQSNTYCAVLCGPDQVLPPASLAAIAAELNKQSQ